MIDHKQDYCLRGISADGSVKLWIANTTKLCDEARAKHDAWSVATAALGRLLTAGVFLGLGLKGEDTVTLKVEGDGPLGNLLVVGNAKGEVRGYVANPQVDIPRIRAGKLAVGTAVGKGSFTVIKDMGFGEPYCGTVPLETGEIGEDLVRYLLDSEQIHSAAGLGVLVAADGSVKGAGGFLVQLLPNAQEEVIKQLELNIANLMPISTMIENCLSAEEIGNEIMLGIPWQALEVQNLAYKCTCSRERMSAALISLGEAEINDLIAEKGEAELVCRFCGQKYNFAKTDLQNISEEIGKLKFQRFMQNLNNQAN